ncbi:hypothetical protein LJC60_08565 [Ruminococcaceae bacterium OttesenSCG-928-D13]|nr:hypothetical protein [Ruminococcaceae bacterium OttesenSCG-928-D13]
MYEGKPSKLFARYAVPQMVGLLFNSVYLIVDGVFIGNRLSRAAMAAAAVSVPFIEILIALAMAVASGAGILISSRLGNRDSTGARQAFKLAIRVLAILGAGIVVLGNLFISPLARLLGATPQIQDEAVTYLWYIVTFSPFQLFSFLLGGLVRNDGRPKLAMFALAFGSVSNIVLDWAFMYPMNMGIAGAALATALGPIFSVLILLPHFLLKKGELYFTKDKVRPGEARRVFALGFPAFIMEFTIGIITFLYNFAIVRNGYGELGLAAYLIIGYLMLILLTVFLGLAEGLQPVFSYLAGAGQELRGRALRRFSTGTLLGIGVLAYGLILLGAKGFITMFAPGDAELVAFTHGRTLVYFSGFFLAGFNILMISYWQSVQQARSALPVSLLRSVVLPPVLLLALPPFFGPEAIWLCHSLSEVLTAGAALLLLRGPGRLPRRVTD